MNAHGKLKPGSLTRSGGLAAAVASAAAVPYRNIALMMNNPNVDNNSGGDLDFKMFQFKKQQAELNRNQQENDLKENHPYFDKPLFVIGRESSFREFCQMIVEARYIRRTKLKENTNASASNTNNNNPNNNNAPSQG